MKNIIYPIEKKLRLRLILTVLLYTIIGYILFLSFNIVYLHWDNPITEWIYLRVDNLMVLYLLIGFLFVFLHYWKTPWAYLNDVVMATQIIYEQNDQPIVLSKPLEEVEKKMNQVKMSVLLSKRAIQEAEDKKNELVMYLAHDIRTPLTTIIGYLSLLNEAPDMPMDQTAKYVGIALNKAERLEKLINELFEITRFHAKTITLKKEKLDLYCLLVQLVDEFYPAMSERGNAIVFDADEDLKVNADSEKLARVFNNLLKNAITYSYPDTEISLKAKREFGKVEIIIQNHGKTIPAEQLSDIFDKFIRLDEARLSDTGGAGLGLSIAQEIIHLHGGEISVKSEDNMITFVVVLPTVN